MVADTSTVCGSNACTDTCPDGIAYCKPYAGAYAVSVCHTNVHTNTAPDARAESIADRCANSSAGLQ